MSLWLKEILEQVKEKTPLHRETLLPNSSRDQLASLVIKNYRNLRMQMGKEGSDVSQMNFDELKGMVLQACKEELIRNATVDFKYMIMGKIGKEFSILQNLLKIL